MAEQTQALKLLSEGKDGLTVIRDYYHTADRRKELLFGHLLSGMFGQGSEGFQVLKLLDARTTDNI